MWTISDTDKAALSSPTRSEFRSRVIARARQSLDLAAPVDEQAVGQSLEYAYDRARGFLELYDPDQARHVHDQVATEDSHLHLTLMWAMLGDRVMMQGEPWVWLNNDRISINTRINLAFRITRNALRER